MLNLSSNCTNVCMNMRHTGWEREGGREIKNRLFKYEKNNSSILFYPDDSDYVERIYFYSPHHL
jgi:hypothetical protein